MPDQISRTNETKLSTEEELNEFSTENELTELSAEDELTELGTEEETEVTKEPSLRERVFRVCDEFNLTGKNITRDLVRNRTGGSCRDLSKYIKEWRENKGDIKSDDNENNNKGALVVQQNSNIETQSSEQIIQTEDRVQTIKTSLVKRQSKNAASVAMTSANRAAGVIIAEEKGFQYLLENPDQLPSELKEQVAKAISESDELMNERSARFELNFFTEMVLANFVSKE
jgi:Plasmid replication region DNA-binding N-term